MSAPNPADEAVEWLFDYMLGVFQSPSWESPMMDFIDAHAWQFSTAEENKLAYTDIHRAFCDLVDGLLEEHLSAVGLTAEEFVQVCARARSTRHADFTARVFEHLMAVDDFLTFKKLMCKRRAELELATLHAAAAAATGEETVEDDEVAAAMKASLHDAEEVKAQAALETAMLEAAIAASLNLENERLRLAREAREEEEAALKEAVAMSLEAEAPTPSPSPSPTAATPATVAGAGAEAAVSMSSVALPPPLASLPTLPSLLKTSTALATTAPGAAVSAPVATRVVGGDGGSGGTEANSLALTLPGGASNMSTPAHPVTGGGGVTAARAVPFSTGMHPTSMLPSLKAGASTRRHEEELAEQRRAADAFFDENRARLTATVGASAAPHGVSAEEVERRAEHLRKQRNLLQARLKAERDAALADHRKAEGSKPAVSKEAVSAAIKTAGLGGGDSGEGGEEAKVEERRQALRLALATRLKADLLK